MLRINYPLNCHLVKFATLMTHPFKIKHVFTHSHFRDARAIITTEKNMKNIIHCTIYSIL